MGIYASEKQVTKPTWDEERQLYVWTEERNPGYGATYRREVTATKWVEHERKTCFCCSCNHTDYGTTSDPYCRNHGFAGTRACEVHNMRGTGVDTEPFGDDGYKVILVKLRTVQQENAHNEAAEREYMDRYR